MKVFYYKCPDTSVSHCIWYGLVQNNWIANSNNIIAFCMIPDTLKVLTC